MGNTISFIKFSLFLTVILLPNDIFSQTYLYKRIAIVKDGYKQSVNDDAHFITFNKKGCYESDSNGYAISNGFIKFQKNEKNLHCYYGQGAYGMSHYYFSQDYRRLNIKTDEATFVYECETNGKTTASLRKKNTRDIENTIVVAPPVAGLDEARTSDSKPSSNNRQSDYGYVDCPQCYGSGSCSVCNGKGWNYSMYTQDPSSCSSCQGRKKCIFCQGSGKKYRRIR